MVVVKRAAQREKILYARTTTNLYRIYVERIPKLCDKNWCFLSKNVHLNFLGYSGNFVAP